MFFLTLVFDTSLTFFNQSQILRMMQDANRAYSTGRIRSLDDTEAFVRSGIEAMGATPKVTSTLNGNIIRTTVEVRAGDLGGVGLLRMIADLELRMASQHLVEG